MKEYGMGRLDAPDERDFGFLMRSATPLEAPVRKYRYYQTGPVLDQGKFPHCVGYSWRQWLASAPLMTKGGPSPTYVYSEAQKVDEWPGESYDGTSVRAGAKVLQELGHIKSYLWAFSADEVKIWVLNGHGTVIVGTNWYNDMFQPDAEGFVKITGNQAGGHAYLCIGYSEDRGAFRFVNSWGTSWGDKGRFWIAGDDLDKLIKESGEVCTATEQLVKPKVLDANDVIVLPS